MPDGIAIEPKGLSFQQLPTPGLTAARIRPHGSQSDLAPSQRAATKDYVTLAGQGAAAPQTITVPVQGSDLEANLFSNRAALKLLTSRVAMHLSSGERRWIFNSIDKLLAAGHWDEESSEIGEAPFRSFIRFIILARPRRLPILGVGPTGTLLTAWTHENDSVNAEFLPNDRCLAILKVQPERGIERIAWSGHVARLRSAIVANGAVACID